PPIIYVSGQPASQQARFYIERECGINNVLSCGLAWPSQNASDWTLCKQQIQQAEAFIAVLGSQYAPVKPDGLGIQHRELMHAMSLKKPILVLLWGGDADGDKEDKRRLMDLHNWVKSNFAYREWRLHEELPSLVNVQLSLWQRLKGSPKDTVATMIQPMAVAKKESNVKEFHSHELSSKDVDIKSVQRDKPQTTLDTLRKKDIALKSEPVSIEFIGDVYRQGNLSRQSTVLEFSDPQLWQLLFMLLKNTASEETLRKHLVDAHKNEIVKHLQSLIVGSHAVDNIAVNRFQFRSLLERWKKQGRVADNRLGKQVEWSL
ncbi:MAG: hypothetical protein P1U57_07255, partial [Oleibacter sp.]|nr:hypothetical protein [Thalassolituus sp.]